MNNAEIIEKLRILYVAILNPHHRTGEYVDKRFAGVVNAAADAIQTLCDELATYHAKSITDDKRIAELEAQAESLKEESEAYKFGYLDGKTESDRHIEDLQTALNSCRLRKDEAQIPKECEFKRYADEIPNARNRYCTQCGAYLSDKEFENHTIRYCYWCGSKVKGEKTDGSV